MVPDVLRLAVEHRQPEYGILLSSKAVAARNDVVLRRSSDVLRINPARGSCIQQHS
jgi:hypothetical protein